MSEVKYSNLVFSVTPSFLQGLYTVCHSIKERGIRSTWWRCRVMRLVWKSFRNLTIELDHEGVSIPQARVQGKGSHSRQKERCIQTLGVIKASCMFENPQRKCIRLEARIHIVDGWERGRGSQEMRRERQAWAGHGKPVVAMLKNVGFSQ